VEQKFPTLYGRIRAMFNDVGIEGDFRKGLWAECASTATFHDNIIVKKSHNKSPLEPMFKENAKELNNLQKFDEVCNAATKVRSKES
jgi:hypothetical protein